MPIKKMSNEEKVEILVVEDSPTQAEELRDLLEREGYGVVLAASGREALGILDKFRPTLLISDILMPGMDGYEFCKAVKSDRRLKGIPVILVTVLSSTQDVVNAIECGADNFVRKPYDNKYLLERVESVLINRDLRHGQKERQEVEIRLGGKTHLVACERQQIVDLLISVYEEAVHINQELQARQKELSHSNQALNGLYRIAEGLNQCKNVQEVVDKAMDRAMELPGVCAGWVHLLKGKNSFRVAAVRGLPSGLKIPEALEGDCLCRRKLLSGELDQTVVSSLECEQLQKAAGGSAGLRYHATIPLKSDGQTFGILNLASLQEGKFSEEEMKTLSGVGHQIAVALERAQLYEHLEQEVEKRTSSIKYQSTHDTLTGLPNRLLLCDRLQQAILAGRRENQPLALLIIGLNHFKEVNNTLGHLNGDLILRLFGERIKGSLRQSDTLARLEGDKFGVLIPGTGESGATLVSGKILKTLEQPFPLEGLLLDVGISIGIACYPDHGEDADTLIQKADIAMYVAKQAENEYFLYTSERDQHHPLRLALMGELRQAIDRDELFLLYQPKIHLKTGRVTAVEALVRWRHPKRGVIPPDQFVLLAEQTGLIKSLTRWVIRAALSQCRLWRQEAVDLRVAVNLSARNLHDPKLVGYVSEQIRACGVTSNGLELEITESAIMADPARSMETLTDFNKMGVRIAIDDFGTGHSSLWYLKRLPVSVVKIDKSFVMDMMRDRDSAMIVRAIIDLAHNMDMEVVAEGVENQEVRESLDTLGCDILQGYYISPPLSAGELIAWLKAFSPGMKKIA